MPIVEQELFVYNNTAGAITGAGTVCFYYNTTGANSGAGTANPLPLLCCEIHVSKWFVFCLVFCWVLFAFPFGHQIF